MPDTALDQILRRPDVWQAGRQRLDPRGMPTGFAALDDALHLGGWPSADAVELLPGRAGIGEWQLLLPTLARVSGAGRHTLLLSPPHVPYPPALVAAGIDVASVMVIDACQLTEQLWCAEQALRSGAMACVVTWLGGHTLPTSHLRKLLLAARQGGSLLFLYRDARLAQHASPASMRLRLDAATDGGLQVGILKQPGGWSGQTATIPRPEPWLEPSPWHLPMGQRAPGAAAGGQGARPLRHGQVRGTDPGR